MSTILELNNIKKAYDVKMAVDIDKLVIEDGDCVGLVGESGCGKSTLAGIITNTVKLYSGSVIFKGEDISERWRVPESGNSEGIGCEAGVSYM